MYKYRIEIHENCIIMYENLKFAIKVIAAK